MRGNAKDRCYRKMFELRAPQDDIPAFAFLFAVLPCAPDNTWADAERCLHEYGAQGHPGQQNRRDPVRVAGLCSNILR